LGWCLPVEAAVSSVVIVEVEVAGERFGALGVVGVGVWSDPFVEQGLDEAFGFSVGLGAADAGVAWGDL
jgi:hypothetical protein